MKKMHNLIYDIGEISLLKLYKIITRPYLGLIIISSLECLVLLFWGNLIDVFNYSAILFGGVYGSFTIHEFMHIKMMRKYGVKQVEIKTTMLKIEIVSKLSLKGTELILVAISGPITCALMGCFCYGLAIVFEIGACRIIAIIYFLHIINLLPIFADGKMVIKGLFT